MSDCVRLLSLAVFEQQYTADTESGVPGFEFPRLGTERNIEPLAVLVIDAIVAVTKTIATVVQYHRRSEFTGKWKLPFPVLLPLLAKPQPGNQPASDTTANLGGTCITGSWRVVLCATAARLARWRRARGP